MEKREITLDELKLKLYQVIESMELKDYDITLQGLIQKHPISYPLIEVNEVKEDEINHDLAIEIEPVVVKESSEPDNENEKVESNYEPLEKKKVKEGLVFAEDSRNYDVASINYAKIWEPGKPMGRAIPYLLKLIIGSINVSTVVEKLSTNKSYVLNGKAYMRSTIKNLAIPYLDKEIFIEKSIIMIDSNGNLINELVRKLPVFNRKDCELIVLNSIGVKNGINTKEPNPANIVRIIGTYFIPSHHLIDTSPNAKYKATEKEIELFKFYSAEPGQSNEVCRELKISRSTLRSRGETYVRDVIEVINELDSTVLKLENGARKELKLFSAMKEYYQNPSDDAMNQFIDKLINGNHKMGKAASYNYSISSKESEITKFNRIGKVFITDKAFEIEKELINRFFIKHESCQKISQKYDVCSATISHAVRTLAVAIKDKIGNFKTNTKEENDKTIMYLSNYFNLGEEEMIEVIDYVINVYFPRYETKSLNTKRRRAKEKMN